MFASPLGGFLLGPHWEDLHHSFRYVEYAVVVAIAAGIAYLVLKRRAGRERIRASSTSNTLDENRAESPAD